VRDDTGDWNTDPSYPDGVFVGLRYRTVAGDDWKIDCWFRRPARLPARSRTSADAPGTHHGCEPHVDPAYQTRVGEASRLRQHSPATTSTPPCSTTRSEAPPASKAGSRAGASLASGDARGTRPLSAGTSEGIDRAPLRTRQRLATTRSSNIVAAPDGLPGTPQVEDVTRPLFSCQRQEATRRRATTGARRRRPRRAAGRGTRHRRYRAGDQSR
jgi:hypothetical protein